jgi:hypothetical protein
MGDMFLFLSHPKSIIVAISFGILVIVINTTATFLSATTH